MLDVTTGKWYKQLTCLHFFFCVTFAAIGRQEVLPRSALYPCVKDLEDYRNYSATGLLKYSDLFVFCAISYSTYYDLWDRTVCV